MMPAGVEIEDRNVLHLAELLRTLELKHVAERLEDARNAQATELALETADRHALMHALVEDESGEPDLGALGATLLQQQAWSGSLL